MEARRKAYGKVATELSLKSDSALRALLGEATPTASGIGGRTSRLRVAETDVFVKEIRLTDTERHPRNIHSTANHFRLPPYCHYGLGTPGFGAWRELAVHRMTTHWVLAGEREDFPLTYHWRVLPTEKHELPPDLKDVEKAVEFWGGGPEIRHRIEELRDATASVTVFMEYVPHNLDTWLRERLAGADERTAAETAEWIERELIAGARFMNDHGLLHFDAHFENILTDGHALFFADYGLAVSERFELSAPEAEFFERHRMYDVNYIRTHLVRWLERNTGSVPEELLARHGELARRMGEWHRELREESRDTPYPG